jgi:C1A family cysteine protease
VNHAVTIVGFGTDHSFGQEYFIIKNSFGTDWGMSGYAKISTSNSPKNVLGSCNILAYVAQPKYP